MIRQPSLFLPNIISCIELFSFHIFNSFIYMLVAC